MRLITAVLKPRQPVIPPGPGKEDGGVRRTRIPRKIAAPESEAFPLLQSVCGRRHIAVIPPVKNRHDLAVFKQGFAAAEDEIDRALDPAVRKALTQEPVLPQLIREEAVVALDQIRRQRAEEERVLRGAQQTAIHLKIVAIDAQRNLLPLFGGVKRVVDDRKITHAHTVGADCHSPGAEGVVLTPLLVKLPGVIVPDQDALCSALSDQMQTGRPDDKLLPPDTFAETEHGAGLCAVNRGLEIFTRKNKYFSHTGFPSLPYIPIYDYNTGKRGGANGFAKGARFIHAGSPI